MRALIGRWVALVVAGCVLLAAADLAADDELAGPLTDYFQCKDADRRVALAEQVAELVGDDFDRLERALPELPLWKPIPAGNNTVDVRTQAGRSIRVALRVPQRYDPQRAWPMIIALHGTSGKAEQMCGFVGHLLGEQAEDFVIAAPQDLQGMVFRDKEEVSTHPADLLAYLRRHVHVDNDRVYLAGYSLGGHGTWVMGALYADSFAGIMPLAGTFYISSREYLWPLMVHNFGNLPVLACWGAGDIYGAGKVESPTDGIAGANRRIMLVVRMEDASLPITGVELPDRDHHNVTPPPDKLQELLSTPRMRYPRRVTHWFRYASQGSAYWMRQNHFWGKPWQGEQIVLRDVIGKNPRMMAAEYIARRLGELSGQIDGQTITITARHTSRFELRLHDELIDLDQPIIVQINGHTPKTYEVQRSVADLLAVAFETWDFQRTCRARLELRAPGGDPPPIPGIDRDEQWGD